MNAQIKHNQLIIPTGTEPENPDEGFHTAFALNDNTLKHKDNAGNLRFLTPQLTVSSDSESYGATPTIRVPYNSAEDLGSYRTRLKLTPTITARKWFLAFPYTATMWINGNEDLTITSPGATVVNEFKNKHFVSTFTTAATSGSTAGITKATAEVRPAYNYYFSALVHTGSDISLVRMWVGMFAGAPQNLDDPNNTVNFSAFQYTYTDGNIYAFNRNQPDNQKTLIQSIAADTSYLFEIWQIGTSTYYRINGGSFTVLSTVVAPLTASFTPYIQIITNQNTSKSFSIASMYVEF